MSSVKARESFKTKLGVKSEKGWKQISSKDIDVIAGNIAKNLKNHGYGDCTLEIGKISIRKSGDLIDMAEIRVNQKINGEDGWNNRQGITFESDGFIGFCGWADSHNSKPFVDGFMKWLEDK